MKAEHVAIMLLEMAAGIILGAMIFSYVGPALTSTTTAVAA